MPWPGARTCDRCGAPLPERARPGAGGPAADDAGDAAYALAAQYDSPYNVDRRGPADGAGVGTRTRPGASGAFGAPSSPLPPDPFSPAGKTGSTGRERDPDATGAPDPDRAAAPTIPVPVPKERVAATPVAAPQPSSGGPRFGHAPLVSGPVGAPGVRVPISPRPVTRVRTGPSRLSGVVVTLLLVVALAAGAYVVYPHIRTLIRTRAVPKDLRAYVGGQGVPWAPAGEGYAVRLPEPAVRRDGPVVSAGGGLLVVYRSIVAGSDYDITIRVVTVSGPIATSLPHGLAGALHDPSVSGIVAPLDVRLRTFAGFPAYDFRQRSSQTQPLRGRVFLRGARLYVISVQSKASDTVFGSLAQSFRLTA